MMTEIPYADYYDNQNNVTNDQLLDMQANPKWWDSFLTQRYDGLFESISKVIDKESAILEIGSRTGTLLRYLNDKGYTNLYGVEICKRAYDMSVKDKSLTADNIYFADMHDLKMFDADKFDLVIASEVLEHSWDVRVALNEVKRILKSEGYFYAKIPIQGKPKYEKLLNERGHFQYWSNPKTFINEIISDWTYEIEDIFLYDPDPETGKVFCQGFAFFLQQRGDDK
jgi:SAM-dependent methyltransferase